jgi:hypothetical protein
VSSQPKSPIEKYSCTTGLQAEPEDHLENSQAVQTKLTPSLPSLARQFVLKYRLGSE